MNPLPCHCFVFLFRLLFLACLAGVSAFGQTTAWRNVEIGGGGFVTGTVFHPTVPGLVYTRTDVGGAYRLDPGSTRWIPLNDDIGGLNNEFQHLGVLSLAVDPNDTNRLYLATGQYAGAESWKLYSRFYRSYDRGNTWSYVPLPFKMAGNGEGRGTGERIAVDPTNSANILIGSSASGLWRSTDSGSTWTRVPSFTPTNTNFVLYAPRAPGSTDPNIVFAAAANLGSPCLWKSSDNGETWSPVPGQPGTVAGAEMMPLQGSFDADGVFYLTWADATGPSNSMTRKEVWKLLANGRTWMQIQPPGGQGGFAGIAADPRRSGHLLVTTLHRWYPGDEIYRSTDGGSSWVEVLRKATRSVGKFPWASSVGPHWMTDIDIDPFDSERAIFNTGYGLYQTRNLTSTDALRVWEFFNNGLEELVPLSLLSPAAGPPLVSVVGDYTGFRHDDLDHSPPRGRLNPGGGNGTILGAGLAPQVMLRQNSTATYFSKDFAITWSAFPTKPSATVNGEGRTTVSADALRWLWCPPNDQAYISTDDGSSWTPSNGSISTRTDGLVMVSTLAGTAGTSGFVNQSGAAALFSSPSGVAVDAKGVRYIADTANHLIRKISSGAAVSTFAGGAGISGTTNGTGTAARFSSPEALAIDTEGNLFVADTGNHSIRKITPAGVVSTLAGGTGTSGNADGIGVAASFNAPSGIAVAASGEILVADTGNHTLRLIAEDGTVTTLAGSPGLAGTTDGVGSLARFFNPRGVAALPDGTWAVADSGNHTIRKISRLGETTTVAGSAGISGSANGTGSAARFNTPSGLACDTTGTLYVADTGNHGLRKISPAAGVSTIAGSPGLSGSADGTGTAARFNTPLGIASDPGGNNLYIADAGNHTLRRATGTYSLTPIADRADPLRFYLWDSTLKRLFLSSDGGSNFTVVASNLTTPFSVFRPVPGMIGHLWATTTNGELHRSTNSGASFTRITNVSGVYRFDFGRAAPSASHPAVFIWGTANSTHGFHRSDNTGASWTRLNDDLHDFGYISDLVGDPRVFGRFYLGTSGRGVIVGEIQSTPPVAADSVIYDDAPANAWNHASPADTMMADTTQPYSGTAAISVPAGFGKGVIFTTAARSLVGVSSLSFWIHGGNTTPPALEIGISRGGIPLANRAMIPPPVAGWRNIVVPLADISAAGIEDLTELRIVSRNTGSTTPSAFFIDNVMLLGPSESTSDGKILEISNIIQPCDGTAKSATITTSPADLPVQVTYNGSPTPPTQAGRYEVLAWLDAPWNSSATTATMVLSTTEAGITFTNLDATADGTPKSVNVATNPPGLATTITYNGSTTPPTLAGRYPVIATISDINHHGTASATLVIRQPSLPATGLTDWLAATQPANAETSSPLLNPGGTPGGAQTPLYAQFPSITLATPGDRISLTGSFTVSAPGTSGQINWLRFGLYDRKNLAPGVLTGWLGYSGMVTSLWERLGQTTNHGVFSTGYDATQRTPDPTPTPVGLTSPADTPTIRFEETITRTQTGVIVTYQLQRADDQTPLMSYTYTDSSPNNNGADTANTTANTGYNPTYNAAGFGFAAGYLSSTNIASVQFSDVTLQFTPSPPTTPQSIDFPAPDSMVFGGSPAKLTATASSGLPVTFSLISGPATLIENSLIATGAGTVVVRASQPGNYTYLPAADVDLSIPIAKGHASITLAPLLTQYDGTAKSVSATTDPPDLAVQIAYETGTPPISAGNHAITATLDDPNYEATAAATLIIEKGPQSLSFQPPTTATFGEEDLTLTATATSGLLPVFSVVSGPASFINDTTLHFTGAGSVIVRASQPGDENFLAAPPVEVEISVEKATATVEFTDLEMLYDGLPKLASVITSPPGLGVEILYAGSATAPFAAGSYPVTAGIADANYQGSAIASGVLHIRPIASTRPVTGWTVGTAGRTVSAADTDSPLLNPNAENQGASTNLQAFFPAVRLATVGDTLTLTGTVALDAAGTKSAGHWFRFGLFDNRNQATTVLNSWLGYAGMANSVSSQMILEKTATNYNYLTNDAASGAWRIPNTSPTPTGSSSPSVPATLTFRESITRTATGVTVEFFAQREGATTPALSLTYSDTSPNNNGIVGSQDNNSTDYHPIYRATGFFMPVGYISATNKARAQFSAVTLQFSPGATISSQAIDFPTLPDLTLGSPPLTLTLTLAATANSGLPVTFSLVSGPATLDENQLTPTAVGTVIIRASQPGNALTSPAPAVERTLNIVPTLTPLESWRVTHFSTPENSGNAANTADPDHDGLANLVEWALGTHPLFSSPAPWNISVIGETIQFSYHRSVAARQAGTLCQVESSDTLTPPWLTDNIPAEEILSSADGLEHVRVTIPTNNLNSRFLRLRITQP